MIVACAGSGVCMFGHACTAAIASSALPALVFRHAVRPLPTPQVPWLVIFLVLCLIPQTAVCVYFLAAPKASGSTAAS